MLYEKMNFFSIFIKIFYNTHVNNILQIIKI